MQSQQECFQDDVGVEQLGLPQRYRLTGIVGRGGMGCVYGAHDSVLNAEVAIKMLHEDLCATPEGHQRFLREARALASLHHEYIVKIRHLGISETGRPYQVVDLLQGETLGDRLKRAGPLRMEEFRLYFAQISEALEYSSSQSIIHRDIKPGNIFLCRAPNPEEPGKAVLLDFGISKRIQQPDVDSDNTLTVTNVLIGSPLYMSPEQCRGKQVDACSDIYSLGCVMYESLAGHPPLRGETNMETMFMHTNKPAPLLMALHKGGEPISNSISELVAQCLQKLPESRPQSFAEVRHRLEQVSLDTTSVRFVVDEALVSTQKKGKLALAGPATALLLVLLLLFAGKFILKGHEERQLFGPKTSAEDALEKLASKTKQDLQRYQRSSDVKEKESRATVLREELSKLATAYMSNGRYDEAELTVKELFPLCQNLPDKVYRRVRIWSQLFDMAMHRICRRTGDTKSLIKNAEQYVQFAIKESESSDLMHVACESHLRLVRLYCVSGRAAHSRSELETFLRQARDLPPPSLELPEVWRPTDRRIGQPCVFLDETPIYLRFCHGNDLLILCDLCTALGEHFEHIGRSDLTATAVDRATMILNWFTNEQQTSSPEFLERVGQVAKLKQVALQASGDHAR